MYYAFIIFYFFNMNIFTSCFLPKYFFKFSLLLNFGFILIIKHIRSKMNAKYSIRKYSEDATVKRPKELGCYSRNIEGNYTVDDSQLNYYYLADGELNSPDGIDVGGGYANFQKNENVNAGEFEGLLKCIMNYEREHGKKVSAKVITWRGLLRTLMLLPFENRDKLVYNIFVFDGQLFMQTDYDFAKESKEREDAETNDINKKFIYSGYKFESMSTLPKPWLECTRKEIEKRNKLPVNNIEEYCIMVKTSIGSTSLLLGAEVDCVYDFKPTDGSNALSHYVELKTTTPINDPEKIFAFERKLLKTWAQCFLVGIPRIIYGFRDSQLKVRSIEEFKTEDIPLIIKNNPISVQKQQQNPNLRIVNKSIQSIKYLSGILEWIVKEIDVSDESKTYRLEFDPNVNSMFVSLTENSSDKTNRLQAPYDGAKGGMLLDEFREWRNSLRK